MLPVMNINSYFLDSTFTYFYIINCLVYIAIDLLSSSSVYASSLSNLTKNNYSSNGYNTSKLIKISLKKSQATVTNTNYELKRAIRNSNNNDGDKFTTTNHSRGSLVGTQGQGYYMEVLIGMPSQSINVLIDTGSGNFAVATTAHPYIKKYFNTSLSSTFSTNWKRVSVPYTQGEWVGYLGRDILRIPSMDDVAIVTTLSFITESTDFFIPGGNWEGIWGLGYADIAKSYSGMRKSTFWDDIVETANINDVFSLSLCNSHGSLTLGGIDGSEYTGELLYVPIRKEWYYEVVIIDIKTGERSLKLDCKEYNFDKTIIDSGTTYLHLPPTVFQKLLEHLTNIPDLEIPDNFWRGFEVVCYYGNQFPWDFLPNITISLLASSSPPPPSSSSPPPSSSSPPPPSSSPPPPPSSPPPSSSSPPPPSSSSPPSMYATLNDVVHLTISPQLYVREIYTSSDWSLLKKRCYRFSVAKSPTAGTVIGAVFMEGFYIVFDREKKRLGFGKTACNDPTWSSAKASTVPGNFSECSYYRPEDTRSIFITSIFISVLICSLFFFSIAILVIRHEFCLKPLPSPTPSATTPLASLKPPP